MISNILQKHVLISMSNGSILEGFITNMEGEFLKMVEIDNSMVVININDISFARIQVANKEVVQPKETKRMFPAAKVEGRSNEFSMELPNKEDTIYKMPTFERTPEGSE